MSAFLHVFFFVQHCPEFASFVPRGLRPRRLSSLLVTWLPCTKLACAWVKCRSEGTRPSDLQVGIQKCRLLLGNIDRVASEGICDERFRWADCFKFIFCVLIFVKCASLLSPTSSQSSLEQIHVNNKCASELIGLLRHCRNHQRPGLAAQTCAADPHGIVAVLCMA